SPMHSPAYVAVLRYLCQNRWLWEILLNVSALLTLVMEIGFPFLIWVRPLRWMMLALAVMLHTGIAVFMGLNTFSLFMMTMLFAFVPREALHGLLQLPARGAARLRLEFNSWVRGQVRAASVVRAFDVWDQVEIEDVGKSAIPAVGTLRRQPVPVDVTPVSLATEQGEVCRGFPLIQGLVCSLRLLWPLAPLAWLLGVTGLGKTLFPGDVETRRPPHPTENGKHHGKGAKVAR